MSFIETEISKLKKMSVAEGLTYAREIHREWLTSPEDKRGIHKWDRAWIDFYDKALVALDHT